MQTVPWVTQALSELGDEAALPQAQEEVWILAVDPVAQDGVPHVLQVYPQLVRATRLRSAAHQAELAKALEYPNPCEGGLPTGNHAHLDPDGAVFVLADGRLDALKLPVGPASYDRPVGLAHPAFLEVRLQALVRHSVSSQQADPAGVLVQAMGQVDLVLRVVVAKHVDESPGEGPSGGMHQQSRWLVDSQAVLVFVQNRRERGHGWSGARFGWGQHRQLLARHQQAVGLQVAPVGDDPLVTDRPPRSRQVPTGQPVSQETIDAQARSVPADEKATMHGITMLLSLLACNAPVDDSTLLPKHSEDSHHSEDTGWGDGWPPLSRTASWESKEEGYATGAGFADFDGDGDRDLLVAYGNDIQKGPLALYENADGALSTTAVWLSESKHYYGHLSIGDLDGDGDPDVAVSRFLGDAGFSEPGGVEVWLNDGGALVLAWEESGFHSFSCALGDIDGDGDLDLAAAVGKVLSIKFTAAK